MTLIDELKNLHDKIKGNQAHHYLDREAAKISALSPGELEKYEYLTGEIQDINQEQLKKLFLNILQQTKFLIKDQKKMIKKKDFWKG